MNFTALLKWSIRQGIRLLQLNKITTEGDILSYQETCGQFTLCIKFCTSTLLRIQDQILRIPSGMVPTRHSLKLVMISQCFRTKNRKIHCSKKLGTLLKMYIKFYTSCFISGNISIQLSGMSLNIQFINFTHGWFQLLHNVSRITAHPEK